MADSIANDLARFEAMLEVFERYLDGTELYRKVPVDLPDGGHEIATMSVGVMLDLAEALWSASGSASDEESAAISAAFARFTHERDENAAAYEEKLKRELRSNLDAWGYYIEDCKDGEATCADDFPSEVRKRMRITGLLAEAERRGFDVAAERARVAQLDADLRDLFVEDAAVFHGPEGQAARYPATGFWWLYGCPRRGRD
ncbi:MAG: hypothetical protein ACK2UL_07675 [Anaerolineae bacterium]